MNQDLLNLILALTAGELTHNVIESQQVRKKVEWLRLTIAGKPYHDPLPFAVDTRAKSYALSLIGLVGFAAIFYVIFSLLDITGNAALWVVAVILIVANLASAVLLDKYHVEIEQVTKPFRKR